MVRCGERRDACYRRVCVACAFKKYNNGFRRVARANVPCCSYVHKHIYTRSIRFDGPMSSPCEIGKALGILKGEGGGLYTQIRVTRSPCARTLFSPPFFLRYISKKIKTVCASRVGAANAKKCNPYFWRKSVMREVSENRRRNETGNRIGTLAICDNTRARVRESPFSSLCPIALMFFLYRKLSSCSFSSSPSLFFFLFLFFFLCLTRISFEIFR